MQRRLHLDSAADPVHSTCRYSSPCIVEFKAKALENTRVGCRVGSRDILEFKVLGWNVSVWNARHLIGDKD